MLSQNSDLYIEHVDLQAPVLGQSGGSELCAGPIHSVSFEFLGNLLDLIDTLMQQF